MNWQTPHFLWLLLLPAAAAVVIFRRHGLKTEAARDRILRGVAEASSITVEEGSASGPVRRAMPRLWLAVACAILALARPQWGLLEEPVFSQSREILVAIDLSRSMLSPDINPSRLERAKLLTRSLLERLKGERIGLVVFSGTAFLQCPLSTDYEIFREFLPALNPKFLPEGGTNYTAMLDASLDAFSKDGGADHYLIILSDGEASDEAWRSKLDQIKQRSIKVISLGVGTAAGAMIPDGAEGFVKDDTGAVVLSKLESATLQELAAKTGGTYVDASAWVDLEQVLKNTVEAGKKGDFRDSTRQRLAERYQWPLAAALLFLVWSVMVEFPVRPRARKISKLLQRPATGAALRILLPFLILATQLHAQPAPKTAVPPESSAATAAAPLSAVVKELADAENLRARDWLRVAKATSDYAHRTQGAQAEVSERSIRDGLEAVDRGEKADPKLAPWEELRKDLRTFLEKKDPPPQDKQDQKDQKDQKDDKKQEQKQDQNKQNDQKNQSKDKDPSKHSESKDNQDSAKDQNGAQPTPTPTPERKSSQEKNGSSENDKKEGQTSESATPTPTQKPSKEMQKVGGSSDRKPKNEEGKQDAALAVPLQKLDQVRTQDSPAELFQLMQGKQDTNEPSKGKTW